MPIEFAVPPNLWLPPKPAIIRPAARPVLGLFPFPMVPPYIAASGPPTVSYRTTAGSASDLTTYTFSTQDIGTAGANRHVIVAVIASNGSGARTASLTIAGVSATQLVQANQSGGGSGAFHHCSLHIAAVPTGTTGDIVVTFSAGQNRCRIMIWAVYDLSSTTPGDTATSTSGSSQSLDVDTVADGIVIAAGCANSGGTATFAWTGVTEDADAATESLTLSGGNVTGLSAQTPRTVTGTITSGVDGCGVAVAMR